MNNFLLEQQQKAEKIAILTEFIHSHPEARELKRAIAVKMALQRQPYFKITQLLGMNKSCVTNWKQRFEAEGLDGIKVSLSRCEELFNFRTTYRNYDMVEEKRLLQHR